MSRPFYSDANGQKYSSSNSSSSQFSFPHDFSGTNEDTDILNTPLEPLRPADVPFGVSFYFAFDLDGECKFIKTKHYSD